MRRHAAVRQLKSHRPGVETLGTRVLLASGGAGTIGEVWVPPGPGSADPIVRGPDGVLVIRDGASSTPVAGPLPIEGRVDRLVQDLMARLNIPGMAVAVIQDGQVALAKGYGMSDIAADRKADADTRFEIGSVTKTYTAFALMRLVDNPALIQKVGVTSLDLDAPISTYLSADPTNGFDLPANGAWNDITPRQLLSMSAGLPDLGSNSLSWQEILQTVSGELDCPPPGSGYLYSDPSFMLLGELIQQLITPPGDPTASYADFVQQQIFDPFSLTQTVIRTGTTTEGQAVGYSFDSKTGQFVPETHLRPGTSSFSSGAISTSANDMAKYLQALWNRQGLDPSTYQEMWTGIPLTECEEPHQGEPVSPGLGWDQVVQTPQGLMITKNGGLPGFGAQYTLFADEGLAIAVATNIEGPHQLAITQSIREAIQGPSRRQSDFDGDGKTDLTVFRTSQARWLSNLTAGGVLNTSFGAAGLADIPAPGDYDGDGRTDLVVFRPASAQWLGQLTGGVVLDQTFGATNLADIPTPGDYDGDGKTDLVVFRPSTAQWLGHLSGGTVLNRTFGATGLFDIPVPGDFDSDARTDLAVFRPSTAQWLSNLSGGGVLNTPFGATDLTDVPAPGDYDGDGKTDLVVFRPMTAQWLGHLTAGSILNRTFGALDLTDLPTMAPAGSLVALGRVPASVSSRPVPADASAVGSSTPAVLDFLPSLSGSKRKERRLLGRSGPHQATTVAGTSPA